MKWSEHFSFAYSIAGETASIDSDRLWTEADMLLYAKAVQDEVARRTLCLFERGTDRTIVTVNVQDPLDMTGLEAVYASAANSDVYGQSLTPASIPLPSGILRVYDAAILDPVSFVSYPLVLAHEHTAFHSSYNTISLPTIVSVEANARKMSFNSRWGSSFTILLEAAVLPANQVTKPSDDVEIPEEYQFCLANGLLSHMFRKVDAETFDGARADLYKAEFERQLDEIKNMVYRTGSNSNFPYDEDLF